MQINTPLALTHTHTRTHSRWGLCTGIRGISREHAGKVDKGSGRFDISYHTDSAQVSATLLATTTFLCGLHTHAHTRLPNLVQFLKSNTQHKVDNVFYLPVQLLSYFPSTCLIPTFLRIFFHLKRKRGGQCAHYA